jgi:hypothetical protein
MTAVGATRETCGVTLTYRAYLAETSDIKMPKRESQTVSLQK